MALNTLRADVIEIATSIRHKIGRCREPQGLLPSSQIVLKDDSSCLASFAHARTIPQEESSPLTGTWQSKFMLRASKRDGLELCICQEAPQNSLAADVERVGCFGRRQTGHGARLENFVRVRMETRQRERRGYVTGEGLLVCRNVGEPNVPIQRLL